MKIYNLKVVFKLYKMNLLDPNFYASVPTWIYISGGFGILFITNLTLVCCYCERIRRKKELDIREFELKKKEKKFRMEKEMELKKKENELKIMQEIDNYDDIIISHPMKYSEYSSI